MDQPFRDPAVDLCRMTYPGSVISRDRRLMEHTFQRAVKQKQWNDHPIQGSQHG
jgi:hypothetical protein